MSDAFLAQSREYLGVECMAKIERAIAPLTTEQLWWRANEASNSIGNLILHLSGNVRQWIVGGVGGACAVLARLDASTLSERRRIQRFDTTILGAIYHVVEHFSTHTGQIILLSKMQTGQDAGFYRLRADGTPEPTWTSERPFEKQ